MLYLAFYRSLVGMFQVLPIFALSVFNGLLRGASALCRQLITLPGYGQVWVANLSFRSQSWSWACCAVGRTCLKQRDALLLIRAFAGMGTRVTVWNCCHAAVPLGTLQEVVSDDIKPLR
ncbi:hypothetical protein RAC83_001215 [Xylella fastidiosa]|nr:hypothetical protein [Xylella fastidiosa]